MSHEERKEAVKQAYKMNQYAALSRDQYLAKMKQHGIEPIHM